MKKQNFKKLSGLLALMALAIVLPTTKVFARESGHHHNHHNSEGRHERHNGEHREHHESGDSDDDNNWWSGGDSDWDND